MPPVPIENEALQNEATPAKTPKTAASRTRALVRRLQSLLKRTQEPRRITFRALNVTRQSELACQLELADTGATRRRGLLGRGGLLPGQGLWIAPCEAVHTIGMRFPLDLVYLDRKRRVKKVRTHVPPGRLSACLLAHSVLELPAGTIEQTRTAPGDILDLSAT